jgi:hypothetical protein
VGGGGFQKQLEELKERLHFDRQQLEIIHLELKVSRLLLDHSFLNSQQSFLKTTAIVPQIKRPEA